MTTREHFMTAMVQWINERFASDRVRIDADTPLFETGVITSLRILELIAWTERATGARIPDTGIVMDNFRTIRQIAAAFVHEEEDPHAHY